MKYFLLTFSLLTATIVSFSQQAMRLHKKAILADGHNDVLSSAVLGGKNIANRLTEGHSDIPRWREGGLDVQFFSVFTGPQARNPEGVYKDANQQIDSLESIVGSNRDKMVLTKTYKQVKRAIRENKLAALIGVEGGHMIEDDMTKLEALYQRGMRYLTLTWNNSTAWATSAADETHRSAELSYRGLTDFGKQVVRRMNELGIIVDLSHVGENTFYDAIATTKLPVLLSHSSVWSICPVPRNVKDEQIKAVAKNGGVICINFYSGFISKQYDERLTELAGAERKRIQDSLFRQVQDSAKMQVAWRSYFRLELEKVRPTLADMVDHIDYIVKLVGDDYVGIGSDYDGVSSLPVGLEDVTTYPKITEELLKRGYTRKSIKKILGGNMLRVMKKNFK